MALTQSESNIIYRRLANLASSMKGISEEVSRLEAMNTTFDFNTNLLEPPAGTGLTKAEAVAFITGPGFDYRDFFANIDVPPDGVSGSADRENKVNQLLLAEPLLPS